MQEIIEIKIQERIKDDDIYKGDSYKMNEKS